MTHSLHIRALGLQTDSNPLALPPGSLTVADNVVIQRPGVIQPRPGFQGMTTLGLPSGRQVERVFSYRDDIIGVVLNPTTMERSLWLIRAGGSTEITMSGRLARGWGKADYQPIRAVEMRKNLYLTSASGVVRITAPTDVSAYRAGLMRPVQPRTSATGHGYGTLMSDEALAYRVCETYRAGEVEVRSAPSARALARSYPVVSAKMVTVGNLYPAETGHIYELYRSTAPATPYSGEPTDDMAMVGTYESGASSFADSVQSSSARGAALYTNDTQAGALLENGMPPLCDDLAQYAGMMFFGAAQWAPAVTAEILGIGADWRESGPPTSFQRLSSAYAVCVATAGSTTITGISADDIAAISPGMRIVDVFSSTDPLLGDAVWPAGTEIVSVGASSIVTNNAALQNYYNFLAMDWVELEAVIDDVGTVTRRVWIVPPGSGAVGLWSNTTIEADEFVNTTSGQVRGMAEVANRLSILVSPTTPVSVSAFGDGATNVWTLVAEAYASDVSRLTLRLSRPVSPDRIDDTTGKSEGRRGSKATLAWSKPGEPEHVPPGYFVEIGAADKAIQRIVPARDSLFVFKEDGIWRVSGYGPESLQVNEFDRTVRLVHPDAVCEWAGGVAAWTNKGLLLITEGGYQEIGASIANLLEDYARVADIDTRGFFLAPWVTRDLLLVTAPSTPGLAGWTFVWCSRSNAWTTWSFTGGAPRCAIDVGDELFLGSGTLPRLDRSSDTGADSVSAASVASVNGTVVELGLWGVDPLLRAIYSGGEPWYAVENVAPSTWRMNREGMPLGACEIVISPNVTIEWAVAGEGDPGSHHFWRELALLWGDVDGAGPLYWSYRSDQGNAAAGNIFAPDGLEWGERRRYSVPRSVRRANRLYPRLRIYGGYSQWSIEGLSVVHEVTEARFRRGE